MNKLLIILTAISIITIGCSEDYTGFNDVIEKHHFIEPDGLNSEFMNYTISYKLPEYFDFKRYQTSGSCTLDDREFGFIYLSNPSQQTKNLPDTVKHGWVTPDDMKYGDDSLKFQIELPMYYLHKATEYHEINKEWFNSNDIIDNAIAKLKSESPNILVNKLPQNLIENDGRFKVMEYRYSTRKLNQLIAFNYTEPSYFVLSYDYPRKDSLVHRENFRKILLSFSFKCEESKLKTIVKDK